MFKDKHLEIEGNINNWIKNWLRNGKQRVVFNGTASDWASITSGVLWVQFFAHWYLQFTYDIDIAL